MIDHHYLGGCLSDAPAGVFESLLGVGEGSGFIRMVSGTVGGIVRSHRRYAIGGVATASAANATAK
jgi:hypothetical protein